MASSAFESSLLSGITACSMLVLYISCPTSEQATFPRISGSLLFQVGWGRCFQVSRYTPLFHSSQACCAVQVSSSLGYCVPGHTPSPVVPNTLMLGHPCPCVTGSLPLLRLQHLFRATSSRGHPLTHSGHSSPAAFHFHPPHLIAQKGKEREEKERRRK